MAVLEPTISEFVRIEEPFLTSVGLVGGVFALWLIFVHGRSGIRIDDQGLTDLTTRTQIPWDRIDSIQLLAENLAIGNKRAGLRFVQVSTADGRAIRFADLGSLGLRRVTTGAGIVEDTPHSGLLLGLIAERTGTAALFPPQWLGIPEARVIPRAPMVVPVDEGRTVTAPPLEPVEPVGTPDTSGGTSPVAVVAKKYVGGFVSLFWVGLKTIKIIPALVSFGAFAVLFSWKFAAAILVMIGFHECGHVYAMWRCGVRVKGIYFIPFLGGAAVSQGLAKTRWANAFIQINGPIYGTALALACLAGFYLTDQGQVLLATAAGWGALINLFNLLPIMPLDGGRLLGEVSHSVHRAAGRYAVLGSLFLGAAAAYLFGLGLLWIMVLVGAMEFSRQLTAATQKAMMDRLGRNRPLTYEVNEHFSALARPLTQPRTEKQHARARADFDMLLTEAQLPPMKGWQTAVVTLGYLGLAVVLVLVAYNVSHIPGANHAFRILRSGE